MRQDDRTHGLWERTAPPAPAAPALDGERTADVAIVGAGYTGLSAALHLAGQGVDVIVLEAEEAGFGGSGRNVGLVNAGMWVRPRELPNVLGPVHGKRLLDLLGGGPAAVFDLIERHGIACDATRAGTLHCGVGEEGAEELAGRAAEWQALGAPVDYLDGDAAAEAIGSRVYSSALLDRRAGTIQPLAYARGLAHAALDAGALLFCRSPVHAARRTGGAWRLETPQGAVTAARVIAATNAYTQACWPQLRTELVHLPYFNIATRPLSGNLARSILPGRQGCWDTKEILTSFRFDAHDRLVVGSVGALRGTGRAIHRRWAAATLKRLFPQLGTVEFESEWFGMIGMTEDALPRFHRLDEGVFSFSGYNGRGIAPGTVFGQVLAQHLTGRLREEDLPLPISDARPQRFRTVREGIYEYGAQVAHLTSRI